MLNDISSQYTKPLENELMCCRWEYLCIRNMSVPAPCGRFHLIRLTERKKWKKKRKRKQIEWWKRGRKINIEKKSNIHKSTIQFHWVCPTIMPLYVCVPMCLHAFLRTVTVLSECIVCVLVCEEWENEPEVCFQPHSLSSGLKFLFSDK